jgi:hypothetical protein
MTRLAVVAGLALMLAWGVVGTAQARDGFYLGAGLASQSASGDLDGEGYYINADGTKLALVGEIGSGTGLAWRIGYGFGENFAIEALSTTTSHTANHDIHDESSNATLSALLLGVRLNLPVSDNMELFGRIGYGGYAVVYDSYGLTGGVSGSTFVVLSDTDVTFSGSGTGIGVGAELMLDQVGVELGFTSHQATLKNISGLGSDGSLDEGLSVNITAIDVIVSYYFR